MKQRKIQVDLFEFELLHTDRDSCSNVQNYQIKSYLFSSLVYNARRTTSSTNKYVVFQSLGMFPSRNVRGVGSGF